jgi:uncharacterized protein
MMRRLLVVALPGLMVLVAALGLGRLSFDPDILGMLPPETPEVRGLQVFHEAFSNSDELVMLIEGDEENEGLLPEVAQSLAAALEEAGVAKRARWQPRWMEEGEGMAELLAYLWLNGPEEAVREKSAELAADQARATFDTALSGVATALEGEELVMRAHDPFGFLRHPAIESLFSGATDGVDGYESGDGRFHLLFIEAPHPVPGYRKAGAWIEDVRAAVAKWAEADGGGIKVHLTGEPAFASEIGGAMERDMRGTAGITAVLIGLLFWVVQRRLVLLGGLAVVLALVFLTALGLAGWIYGELSIMAAGFAAILIGLAVDYGVLICQEGKVAGRGRLALWRATGATVAWAALTTAVVFLALNRSGLPGIAQLGTVVACGIVAGAVLMLAWYAPFVARAGAGRVSRSSGQALMPQRTTALVLATSLGVAALGSLLWRGLPGVDFDERMLRPRDSRAMAAFDRLREAFPEWGAESLRVVVEAPDDGSMHRLLAEAARRLAENPVIESAVLPVLWWPDGPRQEANRAALRGLSGRAGVLVETADAAGFSEEGVALGRGVLGHLGEATAAGGLFYPTSPAARDILRMFISRNTNGGGCFAGILKTVDGAEPAGGDHESLRTLNGGGIWLAGWDLIKPAVVPLVRKDVTDVFLPMAALMVAMLTLIFRSARVVLLCLAAMSLSGLVLLAAMSWLGVGWNFLNIAATPLLLGTGIDYGIHVGLALRRNGGNLAAMWHGTGKAVVFCGVSTGMGFGSLCFASNDAMSSLGLVALIGILASMAVSVFLLPPVLASSFVRRQD